METQAGTSFTIGLRGRVLAQVDSLDAARRWLHGPEVCRQQLERNGAHTTVT